MYVRNKKTMIKYKHLPYIMKILVYLKEGIDNAQIRLGATEERIFKISSRAQLSLRSIQFPIFRQFRPRKTITFSGNRESL